MDLDDVAVTLRSRSAYESTDLGFALGREFWRPIYGAWLLCVTPVFVIAGVVAVWTGHLALALLGVWLMKPAYDRLPLFVVSHGIFGDVPDAKRTVRHTLSRWNSLTVLLDCTVRRLSPYRAFLHPVRELERQAGNEYGTRKSALLRRGVKGPAFLLLGICLAVEQILVLASVALVVMVIPMEFRANTMDSWQAMVGGGELSTSFIVLVMASYFVAVSVVEVFYVAGSFGLYINRRVHLEGWDVEITFKRLARRLANSLGRAASVLAVGAVAVVGTLSFSVDGVSAQPAGDDPQSDEDPRAVAEKVLEAPEFGESKKEKVWVPKEDLFDFENEERESNWQLPAGLAGLLEILMWVAVGVIVLTVGYLIIRRARTDEEAGDEGDRRSRPQPVVEDTGQSRPFRLPVDLVDEAVARWESGDHVGGLSLLYRGTIRGLSERYDIEIEPSMTARECLETVRSAGGPGEYMGRLAGAWISTVYAGRRPTEEAVQRLFREWRRHFTASGGRS